MSDIPEQDIVQPVIKDTKPAPIEEPPLKNRKSCLRRGFSWLFSCLTLAVIVFLLIGWFWSEPGPRRLAGLPNNFPTDIPLYKFEERAGIYYLPGQEKNSTFQRLARLPKLALNYILSKINPELAPKVINEKGELVSARRLNWQELRYIVQKPLNQAATDTVTIIWENISAEERDIYRFFERNLKKQDYQVTMLLKDSDLNFQKEKAAGWLTIKKSAEKNDTVNFSLRVDYPSQ